MLLVLGLLPIIFFTLYEGTRRAAQSSLIQKADSYFNAEMFNLSRVLASDFGCNSILRLAEVSPDDANLRAISINAVDAATGDRRFSADIVAESKPGSAFEYSEVVVVRTPDTSGMANIYTLRVRARPLLNGVPSSVTEFRRDFSLAGTQNARGQITACARPNSRQAQCLTFAASLSCDLNQGALTTEVMATFFCRSLVPLPICLWRIDRGQ